jgi:ABC-type antimicrobial peptide transport system permease subunit
MMLFVVFGSVALVMAAVGVYGVISYSVTQRRGEIAVRSTLGASNRDIMRLIMRHGVGLALIGIVAGVAAAIAMRRVIASQLYEISALDARVLVLVPLVLLVVSLMATLLPALRATRIDPSLTLRPE